MNSSQIILSQTNDDDTYMCGYTVSEQSKFLRTYSYVMSKKAIRFFNDREVWAVWDDENNCWWFSATDVVRAINDEPDYTKTGDYYQHY